MNMIVRVDISSDYYEHIQNTKKIEELSKKEGIYLIVDKNNEIVYVGASWDLRTRISYHPVIKNHFKEIAFVAIEYTYNGIPTWLESYVRNYFRPKYCNEIYTHLNIRIHGRNLYKHAIYSEKLVNRVVNVYEKYIEKQIRKVGINYE